ncbi:TetR/AcrR family transcriptional regulator [Altericroceibacterium xinjiangense]|uniref:TetR/AcrR family transcriptional regulator n=1 Tax=Altericroceibacterium xinjiangense TaxID=762261 RepID=UPI000F7D6A53|nr:TetR/AcrR family transcriptional regulator [Altericroceibacterium xinjiangense]
MAGPLSVPVPQQERSRVTAERFITAALDLLRNRTFAELSVADIAAEADRSIGAFYQRFGSKDDFLEVLLTAYLERACAWAAEPRQKTSASEVLAVHLDHSFGELLANKNLWHAGLQRSAAEPGFWARFGDVGQRIAELNLAAIERSAGRSLDVNERQRLALARQVFNSVINNQIINAPGPLQLDDPKFLPELRALALRIAALD